MNIISELTRRNIVDAFIIERINWCGRLEEPEFLSRLYNLKELPSTDRRYSDASGDIWQHRVNNYDWSDDWVFYDDRFNLMNGDDEVFLRFLCEVLHPVVRSDATEVEKCLQLFNSFLMADGVQLVEKSNISGRPVYVGRHVGVASVPGVKFAHDTLSVFDPGYLSQQITRMEMAAMNDPEAAIGAAKELIESCCKTILSDRGKAFDDCDTLPKLMRKACSEISLSPKEIPGTSKTAELIKRLMNNLSSITDGIAELRNLHGTGHGKEAKTQGLQPRHAKLVVGAASSLAVFLFETNEARKKTEL